VITYHIVTIPSAKAFIKVAGKTGLHYAPVASLCKVMVSPYNSFESTSQPL